MKRDLVKWQLDQMIARRHVFFIAGYDPIDPVSQHRRFRREAAQFEATWNVTAAISALDRAHDHLSAHWWVTSRGPDWQMKTTYELLCWHDIVLADFARSRPRRLGDAAVSLGEYLITGTLARFFAAFWRFGLFFLTPFVEVLLFAVVAIAVGQAVAGAVAPHGVGLALVWLLSGLALFALLLRWPGERWRVSQALALFTFARDYVYRRPDFDQRVERFAERLVAAVRAGGVDEILVVGHSIGAALAADALARALVLDPDLGRRGPSICLLTVGGTIAQVTLHPAAAWLRARVHRVAAEPTIVWAEFQARDDAINFYRFDPVMLVRTADGETGKPQIRRVHLHEMLTAATFQRLRWDFMRLHYQFIMANERRTMYDYFMLVCGPLAFETSLAAPHGPAQLFAPDGSCLAMANIGDARPSEQEAPLRT
jgi:pimeloyl-ACP methyl ester carboxylesterase